MQTDDRRSRPLLIIDDDPGFCDSLAEILESRGYTAICVDTPEHALAALREPPGGGERAAVALIDVRLGGVESGVDLMPKLCDVEPELICVLMTAAIDSATAVEGLRRGAYDYFDKSCDPYSVFAVLDRCFDRVALLRERKEAVAMRLAKEDAERSSRAKSAFLATMSHELRTPLNAIIGFSEIMVREVLGPLGNPQYSSYVTDIHESGAHLLQMINDILDLSKAESGKLDLQEEVFELAGLMRSVRQLVANRLRDGGRLEWLPLPPNLPLLRADERKTKQVLVNLVTNAVKFTPKGGQVEVVTSFDPERGVTVTVSDTGIGIAPADLPRVLLPFEQVESSIARTHHGTGLGLPLVKAIMEMHGGSLELASEVGVGTRATVVFPPHRTVFPPERDAA